MDDLDHGLLALVAAFHRADLEKLHDTETGNGRPGARSHEQAAFDLYEREIVTLEQLFSDRRLALSLDTAVRQDGPIVAELAEVERGAAEDRALALEVARGRSISSAGSNSSNSRSSSVSSTRSSVADSTVSFIRTSREASTSASSYGSPSPVPFRHKTPLKPLKQVQRTICSDHVREDRSVTVPCAHLHRYCNTCAKDLFLLASRDESLFPPRCDGAQIPLTLVQHLLTPHERTLFKRKATEFGTANRLYCSNAPCSEFLGAASDTKKSVRCDSCAQQTCEACKAPWHGLFGACAKGADAEVANALAKDYGYQSCPGCHRLVELSVGCFHMTCLCRKEFCYVCSELWKNCECPQWDENMLVQAAQRRVRLEDAGGPPRAIAERVQRVVEELRVNHECAHRSWSYRSGGGQCESCFFYLPSYLLCCRGCRMLACVRCQRNRL